jgi:hypothetical protein
MKKHFLLFSLLLLSATVCAQRGTMHIDTTGNWHYDSISKTSFDMSACLGNFEMADTIPELRFDTIDQKEFVAWALKYKTKTDTSGSRIRRTDKDITIITGKGREHWFAADAGNEMLTYTNYLGFLEPLNLHIIQSIDTHNEIGDLVAIDDLTGKRYYIASPFDYPFERLLISPGNKWLLTFSNNEYENNQSSFSLLKINPGKNGYRLKTYNRQQICPFNIEDAVWMNDHVILMKVKETPVGENDRSAETIYYLKVAFKI